MQWTGVDGSEGIEAATNGLVRFADLAVDGLPRALRRPWDWTFSMQVAEHIPPSAEAAFMHTLVLHAQRGVVLGWAALGQQGLMHANCQSQAYVACAMRFLGFKTASTQDAELKGIVFRRKSKADALPERPSDEFVAAYRNHTRRQCDFTTWGYLEGSARLLRQLTARKATLGQPTLRRACDVAGGNWGGWRREVDDAMRSTVRHAKATDMGEEGLEHQVQMLYEALAMNEVAPTNRRVLKNLSAQTFARDRSGTQPLALSAENATMRGWLAWLNNTVWGLCVPPKEGFCFYSRAAKTVGRKRSATPCVQ